MEAIHEYTRELHAYINNFETWIGAWLSVFYTPDLSFLCKEMATLCLEVLSLSESYILVIPLVILDFM